MKKQDIDELIEKHPEKYDQWLDWHFALNRTLQRATVTDAVVGSTVVRNKMGEIERVDNFIEELEFDDGEIVITADKSILNVRFDYHKRPISWQVKLHNLIRQVGCIDVLRSALDDMEKQEAILKEANNA